MPFGINVVYFASRPQLQRKTPGKVTIGTQQVPERRYHSDTIGSQPDITGYGCLSSLTSDKVIGLLGMSCRDGGIGLEFGT